VKIRAGRAGGGIHATIETKLKGDKTKNPRANLKSTDARKHGTKTEEKKEGKETIGEVKVSRGREPKRRRSRSREKRYRKWELITNSERGFGVLGSNT